MPCMHMKTGQSAEYVRGLRLSFSVIVGNFRKYSVDFMGPSSSSMFSNLFKASGDVRSRLFNYSLPSVYFITFKR